MRGWLFSNRAEDSPTQGRSLKPRRKFLSVYLACRSCKHDLQTKIPSWELLSNQAKDRCVAPLSPTAVPRLSLPPLHHNCTDAHALRVVAGGETVATITVSQIGNSFSGLETLLFLRCRLSFSTLYRLVFLFVFSFLFHLR